MAKVAFITGAATGMGRGVAESLARQQYKVVIADWNDKDGQQLADEIGADFHKVDVTSWADQYNALDATFQKYGRIDFVYANAGVSERVNYLTPESTEGFTADKPPILLTMDVDLVGVVYSSLLATRYFRRNPQDVQNPLLLLASSAIGIYPGPVAPIYAAAKHGVIGLARSLAARWAEEENGFRCSALAPGFVLTTIMPKATRENWLGKGVNTTVQQIVDGVNDVLHSDRSGQVCEVSRTNRWYRDQPEFLDEVQRTVIEDLCSLKSTGKEFEAARASGEQFGA